MAILTTEEAKKIFDDAEREMIDKIKKAGVAASEAGVLLRETCIKTNKAMTNLSKVLATLSHKERIVTYQVGVDVMGQPTVVSHTIKK